jgi:hypothetical protein
MLGSGFGLTQSVHGETVTILTGTEAGKTYTATILVAPDVSFEGLVTEDRREKCVAHFPDDAFPAVTEGQGTMKDSGGTVWKFVKRTNNPLDTTVDFEVMKVLPNKN